MTVRAKWMATAGIVAIAGLGGAQGYMAQSEAAIGMSNTLQGQGPAPVPGQVPGVGNPGAGFGPAPMGGNTMPVEMGLPGEMGGIGQQQMQMPPPVAVAPEKVLVGRRVYDAVSGGLIEDAVGITVRQEDYDSYPDDGIHDNGIANDGVRGSVNTSRNEFIGYFSNLMKNYLIHAVKNAEQIDPMVYFGHHIAKVNPMPVEGLKRYGRDLPDAENNVLEAPKIVPDFASIIDLERDRDELVKTWNKDFLAEYRVDQYDPQSDYFPVFVPTPPLTPEEYPVPTGYVAPQAAAKVQEQQQDVLAAEAMAAAAATATSQRGGGGLGGAAMGSPGF